MRQTFVKILCILCAIVLLPVCAVAENGITLDIFPQTVRPGKAERYAYTSPASGEVHITLVDGRGLDVMELITGSCVAGINYFIWDGLVQDADPDTGDYTLRITCGDQTAEFPVVIGPAAPCIRDTDISVSVEGIVTVNAFCSCGGTLTVSADTDGGWETVYSVQADEGKVTIIWDGILPSSGRHLSGGEHTVQLCLTDREGFAGTKQNRIIEYPAIEDPELSGGDETEEDGPGADEIILSADDGLSSDESHIVWPSKVTTPDDEMNYWTLPIGVMDEEAIWNVMMQPMTVLKGNQTEVYRLRSTPDKSSKANIIGEITYESQGVHVLETLDNGWTYVEVYNSSYGPNCASRRGYGVTNDLLRGYVETSVLKTITPQDYMGLLIDKRNQTMYIFEDGHITGTLLVSTGLNNKTQSWNETPSGEYIMISKMGGFPAGNLWCAYGMRVNGGCAIHEVPYIGDADTPSSKRDYSSTVKMLGQKASHGCIRVQKAKNEAGQSIKWLWDHMKIGVKVLIWEDSGRYTEYPADSTELYYNPTGGKYFHEDQYCKSVKSRWLPLTAFTYGELDTGDFAKLTPCPKCVTTIMRKTEIDELNRENGF
ncbi:MAG: hypothetical protein CW338_07245 [Clostridiales bacterium]|nr:hypothetical protein [Clostridiales bacterium]